MYWHGILDYSGRDNARLKEVKELAEHIKKIQEIAGAQYIAKVAIVKDYDNVWDTQIDHWHKRIDEVSQNALFTALQLSHVPFDYIYLDDNTYVESLSKYELLLYPHPSIMTKERSRILEKYVAQGGKLVFGCRSGYKDIHGKCTMMKLPGYLQTLTGTDIPEYTFVAPQDGTSMVEWDGANIPAGVFNDILMPMHEEAKILGTYQNGMYEGEGALIKNTFGNGNVYYFGGAFTLETAQVFLDELGYDEPYKEEMILPSCCELAIRVKDGKKYFFVLNYSKEEVVIKLQREVKEVISGAYLSDVVSLKGYETKIFII